MTSDKISRLRVCLMEASTQRLGSVLDRVKALETLSLLLGGSLMTDRRTSEPPRS